MHFNSIWILRANFALHNFLLSSHSTVWLHQHLKMILEEVKLAREFQWGNLTGTVSISGCWKTILQINYILEKINVPQTRKRTSLILMNREHFPGFYRHIPDQGNQYSILNPQGPQTCRGSVCRECGVCAVLSLNSKGRTYEGSASSVTPCQNPAGFPGSLYPCLPKTRAEEQQTALETSILPYQQHKKPIFTLTPAQSLASLQSW